MIWYMLQRKGVIVWVLRNAYDTLMDLAAPIVYHIVDIPMRLQSTKNIFIHCIYIYIRSIFSSISLCVFIQKRTFIIQYNSPRQSDAYRRQQTTGPLLFQVAPSHYLNQCCHIVNLGEQISMKFESKYNNFQSKKINLKMSPVKWWAFWFGLKLHVVSNISSTGF